MSLYHHFLMDAIINVGADKAVDSLATHLVILRYDYASVKNKQP